MGLWPKIRAHHHFRPEISLYKSVQIVFCLLAVHVRKAFQQGTIAKHCVRKIKSVVDENLRRNLLLSDKIVDGHFCDYEDKMSLGSMEVG